MNPATALGPAIAGRHSLNRRMRRSMDWRSIGSDAALGVIAIGAEASFDELAVRGGEDGATAAWPLVLKALYIQRADPEVLREALVFAWFRCHRALVDTIRSRAELSALFRAAEMPPPPSHLGDPIPVWRGGSIAADKLGAGLSWTARRDVACLYALVHAERFGGTPLVLRRVVPRCDVGAFLDQEDAAELVIPGAGPCEVDGDAEAWREAAIREATRQREHSARTIRAFATAAAAGEPPPGPRWVLRSAERVARSGEWTPLPPAAFDGGGPATAVHQPRDSLVTPALVARVLQSCRLRRNGAHGVGHWLRVAQNGLILVAATPGADPALVELFALLHDSQRWAEGGDDPEHGPRAADYAAWLVGQGVLSLAPDRLAILMDACRRHEAGETSTDPTIGCCWDADRLELARLGIRLRRNLASTAAARDREVEAGAWWRGREREVPAELARAWGLDLAALWMEPKR